MFGSHLSIAGGMHNAIIEAQRLSFDTVQVFTKNQQQWKVKPLEVEAIDTWKSHLKESKFKKTVSHDSYLINLASPTEKNRRMSIDLFAEEIVRCAQLSISLLVTHPGAHLDSGEEAGLLRVAQGIDEAYDLAIARDANSADVITCLEITAGQGSSLGYRLEHLADIVGHSKDAKRLGVCLDTAHLFAAGIDFRPPKYDEFRKQIERTIGVRRVKVLHVNDSKKDFGSRVDRHDHIGLGKIGRAGFESLLRDPSWDKIPKILETPKEKDEKGRDWDEVNLETLKAIIAEG